MCADLSRAALLQLEGQPLENSDEAMLTDVLSMALFRHTLRLGDVAGAYGALHSLSDEHLRTSALEQLGNAERSAVGAWEGYEAG